MATNSYTAAYSSGTGNNTFSSPQLAWWSTQKPTDRYAGFNQTAGNYANQFLGAQDPFGAGGEFGGGFNNYMNKIGANFPNINDAQTRKDLGSWNNLLSGNARNLMEENARKMAGIGATSSRFGPAGGSPLTSRLAANMNQNLGQMAGQNINQGMGYMQEYANSRYGAGRDYMNALADAYKTKLGIGGQMMGYNLGGLQAYGKELNDWMAGAGAGLGRDVDWANKFTLQDSDWQNRFTLQNLEDQWRRDALNWEKQKYMRGEANQRQRESDAKYLPNSPWKVDEVLRRITQQGADSPYHDPIKGSEIEYARLAGLSPYWMGGASKANSSPIGGAQSGFDLGSRRQWENQYTR